MKRFTKLTLILLAIVLVLLPSLSLAQSTVVPSVGGADGFIYAPHQRMSFYANGRYWAFYINDATDKFCYRTSTDATTWDAEINIRSNVELSGQYWSVTFDGTYLRYIIRPKAAPNDAFYRRGLPNADGTITWSAAEQTVIATNTQAHTIAVDTDGYAWIAYAIAGNNVNVIVNDNNDGTWSTRAGWPQQLTALGGPPTISALTSGRMACLWGRNSLTLQMQRWDGVAWGAVRTTASNMEDRFRYSAVANDDNIDLVFLKDVSYDIIHVQYDYSTNSFGAETTIYSGATITSAPVMTRATDTNDLFVFWENDPANDHLYYIKYNYYTGAWDTYVDLLDESVIDGLPANGYNLNTDYTSTSDKVGVYYVADPQKLKYKDVAEAASVTTLPPSALTATGATLRGDITATGTGAVTTRGFQYNNIANPTGASDTQESGAFSVGVYSLTITGLEADELYYCRAYVTNSEGTTYGEWVAFLSAILTGSEPVQPDEPDDGMTPPVPTDAPAGWITDPATRTYDSWFFSDLFNTFFDLVSRSFVWFLFMIFGVMALGLALCRFTRHLGIVFIALGLLLVFYMGADYLDWWPILPYILAGAALIVQERQYGWG